MNVRNLSDSILANIFGYVLSNRGVLYSPVYNFKRWRVERSLLSVCKAWRKVALPMVHENAFILAASTGVQSNDDDDRETDNQSESIDDNDSDNYSETSGCETCSSFYESSYGEGTYSEYSRKQMRLKAEDFAATSSMDVIGGHMDNPYPRHIDIIIDIRHNPVTGIKKVLEKARTHSKFLEKVETMELFFYSEYIANELFKLPTDIEEAQEMGIELAQIIPSIKSIKWHKSSGYEHALLGFVKCMVKGYAHQLTEFVLPQTTLDNVENLSDKLESICMYNNVDISRNVPRIPAKNIKDLNIGYKLWNFDWSAFISNSSNSSPKTLVFENLKSLQLRIEKRFQFLRRM